MGVTLREAAQAVLDGYLGIAKVWRSYQQEFNGVYRPIPPQFPWNAQFKALRTALEALDTEIENAVLEERERCARVCDSLAVGCPCCEPHPAFVCAYRNAAGAIREETPCDRCSYHEPPNKCKLPEEQNQSGCLHGETDHNKEHSMNCPFCRTPMAPQARPEGVETLGDVHGCPACGLVVVHKNPPLVPGLPITEGMMQELLKVGVVGIVVKSTMGERITIDFV
jgi:hypothetical protein